MNEQAMASSQTKAAAQWIDMLHAIFPTGAPARNVWIDAGDILALLQRIAARDAHRAYAPDGHCFFLTAAGRAGELGCLALMEGDLAHIIKPARLIFEAVNAEDLRWAWFRLEALELPAAGKDPREADCGFERLLETAPGAYSAEAAVSTAPAPGARPVMRHLGGTFVFLAAEAPYQLGNEAAAGASRQRGMNPSMFRQALAKMADILFKANNP